RRRRRARAGQGRAAAPRARARSRGASRLTTPSSSRPGRSSCATSQRTQICRPSARAWRSSSSTMGTTMLVSIREYARRRGCSHVAVMKAVKSGRLTLTDGKVDTQTADRQWASNTDASQRRDAAALAPASTGAAPGLNPVVTGSPSQITYSTQRAIREGYLARLAKIEFEVKTGKLIEADKVRVKAFNLARKARDMLGG